MKVSKTFSGDIEFIEELNSFFKTRNITFSPVVCKLIKMFMAGKIKLEE